MMVRFEELAVGLEQKTFRARNVIASSESRHY